MNRPGFLVVVLSLGCGGGGVGPDEDAADADADTDVDADSDADTDSDSDTAELDYPLPPYGVETGTTMESLSFAGDGRIVELADFYRAEGKRVLLIWATAGWCSVCEYVEKPALRDSIYPEYRDAGLEILGVVYEDNEAQPATVDFARDYFVGSDIEFPWAADTYFYVGRYFDRAATPLNLYVDLETMEIREVQVGFSEESSRAVIERELGI